MKKLAFLGLGTMGFPMAGHLAAKGHEVTVFNRTHQKSLNWSEIYQGNTAKTVSDAVKNCDLVFCCVGNDQDVMSITTDAEGAFAHMKAGAVFVDHTTTSADLACHLAEQAKLQGISFLDAPVSGGQSGAQNGSLSIMCGGEKRIFTKAEPVMAAYAKLCRLMGPSGSGQRTKMVNQIAIAGLLQGLSEALHFCQKAGLDGEAVLEVISQGAAASWQMSHRGKTMLSREFDFGFAVDWMRKDLAICLDEADRLGADLPITRLVLSFYDKLSVKGGGRLDTSSLIRKLDEHD